MGGDCGVSEAVEIGVFDYVDAVACEPCAGSEVPLLAFLLIPSCGSDGGGGGRAEQFGDGGERQVIGVGEIWLVFAAEGIGHLVWRVEEEMDGVSAAEQVTGGEIEEHSGSAACDGEQFAGDKPDGGNGMGHGIWQVDRVAAKRRGMIRCGEGGGKSIGSAFTHSDCAGNLCQFWPRIATGVVGF